jgi:hypothetical protein
MNAQQNTWSNSWDEECIFEEMKKNFDEEFNSKKLVINKQNKLVVVEDRFGIFEELVIDMEEQNPELFEKLDWNCISCISNLSIDFIEKNFFLLNIKSVLINNKNIKEQFFVRLIEDLLPKSGIDYDIFDILKTIFSHHKRLSCEFTNKYYCTKNLSKIKKQKVKTEGNINEPFENIINYIEENYYEEYEKLDMKTISSYRFLSENFMIRHALNLDYSVLFTHQKLSKELLIKLSEIKSIPLASLVNSRKYTVNFLLGLNPILDTVISKQISKMTIKGHLKFVEPETYDHIHWFRSSHKIYDDCIIQHKSYKLIEYNYSKTTFFLDIHNCY